MKNKKVWVLGITLVLLATIVGMAAAAPVTGAILVGSGQGYKVWRDNNKTWVDSETAAKFVLEFVRKVGSDQYEVWCTGAGRKILRSASDIVEVANLAGISIRGSSALDLWSALCWIAEN